MVLHDIVKAVHCNGWFVVVGGLGVVSTVRAPKQGHTARLG